MTCPNHGEIPANDEVWITDFAGTQETPEEGHYECPACGAELED